MALKQERMLALIRVADELQTKLDIIRESTANILNYAQSLAEPKTELHNQIGNIMTQIDSLTQPDREIIRIIETEKAFYNPARIKHNEYMRGVKSKYKARRRIENNTTDVFGEPSEIDLDDEIPLFKTLEAKEEKLKEKFGEDFKPLPPTIGFPQKKVLNK